jgi:hypothetical protein
VSRIDVTGELRVERFHWTGFDVRGLLPAGWREQVTAVARRDASVRRFPRTPILSREDPQVTGVVRGRVHADVVKRELHWLYNLYHSEFAALARTHAREPVDTARDDRYGVVLNLQAGPSMRFECHVDSNPIAGVLFCTDHPAGTGGELVFAHDREAAGVAAVERDCSLIRPAAGQLVFFGGHDRPHYVRPLVGINDLRIAAVMNFYVPSCPESTRPKALNDHLFGVESGARRS